MNKFVKCIDRIVNRIWFIFCLIIFGVSLIIKAVYQMGDYPDFVKNSLLDIILLLIVLIIYYGLYKNADKIERYIRYSVLWLFFGAIGCVFIYFVPLKPFSDMAYVTEGATFFAKGDIQGVLASEYLQKITKNLKVSMFYGVFGLILPKTIVSFRFVNVILYLLICHFVSKTGRNLGYQYPKLIFILVASFMPLLLYCNHVYFDLPVLSMCFIATYFYSKDKGWKNLSLAAFFVGIACSLRVLAFLFVIAMIIDYLFCNYKYLFLDKCRRFIILISFVFIACALPKTCDVIVNEVFRVENAEDESIWTLFWMGINEQEFGFMHNEIYNEEKEFTDFYNLLTSRNLEQNIKLFGRKVFWEWSQGTYQAQRYAFGADAINYSDKFEYETVVTRFLMQDNQRGRQLINSFCRAQYLGLFALMLVGLWKMDEVTRDKYRMFVYLMFGTFLILIFYELKSRYVMHCMISMVLLAMRGLEVINRQEKRRRK